MVENKMTFLNALELMNENPSSQFEILQHKQHIRLSPKHIGSLKAGVSEVLKSRLYFYNNELGAVPMAFRNVKALQEYGAIIGDQPCLHFDIEAEFITFKPTVGCKLKGVINKVSKQHVGCLVHGCFNGWFPVVDIKDLEGKALVGKIAEFTVEKIFASNRVVSFKGKFSRFLADDEDEINSPLNISDIGSPSSLVPIFTSTQLHTPAPELEPGSKKKNKHKKKSKHKELSFEFELDSTDNVNDTEANETVLSAQNDSVLEESTSSKHKKKKKKHKRSEKSVEDNTVNNDSVSSINMENESVEDGHEKSKHVKKKKRKADQEMPDSSEEFISPKKKMKTKK